MRHELRFSLVMNWLLKLLKQQIKVGQLQAILDALITKETEAEGIEIPSYISDTFATLALPNYICDVLNWTPVESTDEPIPEYLLSTFQRIWSEVLAEEQSQRISVLEPACGSANDYRFIESFGISRFIDYTGFDLCEKNIHNAKQMFPEVDFKTGNILEIQAEDNTLDYCIVQDVFEHLSLEAMEVAISEICRVTRRGICAGFFNMYESQEHIIKTVDDYYWNKLSLIGTKAIFEQHASKVEAIHIDKFLAKKFDYSDLHNKDAYTLVIKI